MDRREFITSGICAAGALWKGWPNPRPKDEIPLRLENSVNGLRKDCVIVFFAEEPNYVLRPNGKFRHGDWNTWSCLKYGEKVEASIRIQDSTVEVRWFEHLQQLYFRNKPIQVGLWPDLSDRLFRHGVSTVATW